MPCAAGADRAGQGREAPTERRAALVCSACTQNNEVRHVVVKSSWGPDGGNPSSTRQGRSHHRTTREGASGRSPTMQYRTERKRSAVRGVRTWGELANGSEAHIRRTGGRIGDGVGTKFCVLTRGDLSASDRDGAVTRPSPRRRGIWQTGTSGSSISTSRNSSTASTIND